MIELALAFSLHLGLNEDYNQVHPHIRYNEQNYIAGAYYNSERNVSFYLGKRWEYNGIGLEAGAVTGYSGGDVLPYGRATYENFFVSPAIETPDTVGVVLGYELKW
jgi:hypothetical protein